ncbi:hypothetical protein [Sphingomonas sp.]|uniref:hypothetical protein n=1 Tax=Sphingomonas sp. TaxID=28214 RepID=UPI003D6C8927
MRRDVKRRRLIADVEQRGDQIARDGRIARATIMRRAQMPNRTRHVASARAEHAKKGIERDGFSIARKPSLGDRPRLVQVACLSRVHRLSQNIDRMRIQQGCARHPDCLNRPAVPMQSRLGKRRRKTGRQIQDLPARRMCLMT